MSITCGHVIVSGFIKEESLDLFAELVVFQYV